MQACYETRRRGRALLLGVLCAVLAAQPLAAAETIKLGVLTDLSGPYSDISGKGAILATQMAADDMKPALAAAGFEAQVLSADQQGKPDVGGAIAREWLDKEGVNAIVNVPNSAVALAVQEITRARKRIFLITGAATSDLTGPQCSPYAAQWTDDTYALARGAAAGLVAKGRDTWFFITADYAFGRSLQAEATRVIESGGGKVLGSIRQPAGAADMSAYLLQAQASGAKVIALANGGTDTINAIKQAHEFQLTRGQQDIVALALFISDVDSLGLDVAQGLYVTTGFYWDRTDATRAWSQRFFRVMGRMPTREHAESYSAVLHYLRALVAERSADSDRVMARMKATPVDDFYAPGAVLRQDGRLMRPEYLAQVKAPAASKYPWDYYQMLATLEPQEAFRPLSAGGCPFVTQ